MLCDCVADPEGLRMRLRMPASGRDGKKEAVKNIGFFTASYFIFATCSLTVPLLGNLDFVPYIFRRTVASFAWLG